MQLDTMLKRTMEMGASDVHLVQITAGRLEAGVENVEVPEVVRKKTRANQFETVRIQTYCQM